MSFVSTKQRYQKIVNEPSSIIHLNDNLYKDPKYTMRFWEKIFHRVFFDTKKFILIIYLFDIKINRTLRQHPRRFFVTERITEKKIVAI